MRQGIEPATSWFLGRFLNHWAMMGTPNEWIFCPTVPGTNTRHEAKLDTSLRIWDLILATFLCEALHCHQSGLELLCKSFTVAIKRYPRYIIIIIIIIYFGCAHGMWKFWGQGLNLPHSSDQSHISDNDRSLIYWATRELPQDVFFSNKSFLFKNFYLFIYLFLGLPEDTSQVH